MPKRQICLCMESYANHLATLFHDNWRTNDPFHAENQRTVAVKASDSLDIILHMVAVNLRINSDEFYDCFPMNFYIYCNPGEVSCHIAGYSSLINIWRGDVNEDRYYDPAPIGIAKYYDGNLNNFQNIVLGSLNSIQESSVHSFGHMGPEQCIPLCLVSSVVMPAYDLFASGFVDIFKIPSTLFRWNSSNTEYFTTRTFAVTRFGNRRPAHNYENIYQIQYNVAYLSEDENIMDEAIAEPAPDNFPDTYQSDSENEHNI
ncbi:Protein Tob1 [Dirofilaria immitis]